MKTLRQFLTENKALDTFCTNVLVKNRHELSYLNYTPIQMTIPRVERLVNNMGTYRGIISGYFTWGDTPQGYWHNLSRTWDNYLYQNGYINCPTAEDFFKLVE